MEIDLFMAVAQAVKGRKKGGVKRNKCQGDLRYILKAQKI